MKLIVCTSPSLRMSSKVRTEKIALNCRLWGRTESDTTEAT